MDVIEVAEDYGVQVAEVVETFHPQGKCVGCDHSKDSWCSKHKSWGYSVDKCGNEPPPPPKKVITHLSGRTAHNAKPVKCSNGITYQSLFLAARAFKVTPAYLRKLMLAGRDYATYTFEFAEVTR